MRSFIKAKPLKRTKPFIAEFPLYKKTDETMQEPEIFEFHKFIENLLTNPRIQKNERIKSILLTIRLLGTSSLQIQQRKRLNRVIKEYGNKEEKEL